MSAFYNHTELGSAVWEVLSETACMLEEMGQLKKLAYVRLERDNMIRAKQFQGKELLAAAESDLELR